MSEQAEVIKLLENIRAKRDLGAFAVEPKKTRKQREAVQTAVPIVTTPVIIQSDLEESMGARTSPTVSANESPTNAVTLNLAKKDIPKERINTPKIKSSIGHKNVDFQKILPSANDDFSLDRNRRIYLNKEVFNKLSLLKIAGDVKNVSNLANAIITQFFEENEEVIENALKDLTK